MASLSSISNPLATPEQLRSSASQQDGMSAKLELTLRYQTALLTQSAGILLKLPQEVIAQAIVILQRFYVGGGSYRRNSPKGFSAAALYLTAKLSFHPQTTRSLLNVYAYLNSSTNGIKAKPGSSTYTPSEGEYFSARETLMKSESTILRTLSYDTHVVLPHTLALTYLQTLSLLPPAPTARSHALAKRTISHLNSALLSPQLLYLTHQPNALAVAAIYLAAREVGVKLSEEQWWRVWDVEREELGFLAVSFGSLEGFVRKEKDKWHESTYPLTIMDLESRQNLGGD